MKRTLVGITLGLCCAVGATESAHGQESPPNATGPCSATAEIDAGPSVDPYASSGVYRIPSAGSAMYVGSVDAAGGERQISGSVVIKSPPFVPDITLTERWRWDGTAVRTSESGTVSWDLPSVLPRGVILTVVGEHNDDGVRCEGSVEIEVIGGPFDSPITPVSLGGTALAAAALGFAARPQGAK